MKLSTFKEHLKTVSDMSFFKEDGTAVPAHFHITEIGQIDKKFIDCGGTMRNDSTVSMQLWQSIDFWHRLEPTKLLQIIELAEQKLGVQDLEIEIEYQAETIGKFGVEFENGNFKLTNKNTACLALDSCGIPVEKVKKSLSNLTQAVTSCCTPNSGCC